jgi:hypothetical protein
MRRTLVIALLTALMSSTFISPSSAAIKSGAKCTSKGEEKISGTRTFTCIKSGTKLIWNKGVETKKRKTKSTSKSSSTSASTASEDAEAAVPTTEVTFANLATNYSAVPYWAWKKSGEKISKSQPADIKVTVLVGPNTDPINKKPSEGVLLTSRMYADYEQSSEFVLIYYNFKDIAWAEKYLDQYVGGQAGYDTSGEVKKMCPSVERCNAAAALMNHKTGIGVTIITASDSQRSDPNFLSGTLEAHEYSHTIQDKQFIGRMPSNRQAPRWLTEGGAEFIQTASVYYESFTKYKINRNLVTTELFGLKTFNKIWLDKFLNPPTIGIDWSNWGDQYEGWRIYDVGYLVSEILVSIAGPNSIMEIFKLMGDGMTYQDSFAKVFGISWDAAIKTITEVLGKQIG